jgi:hypothetical protein
MEIHKIAVANFYQLEKALAVHVAEDCIRLTRLYPSEGEGQIEFPTFRTLYRL